MTDYVLDASVAAKWFLPARQEPFSDEALHLLEGYSNGRINLLVPDLFWPEFGNVLWKAVRAGRIARSTAEEGVAFMMTHHFPTFGSASLLEHALSIALSYNRPVYDCVYVALAILSRVRLVTADERLANALGAHFPVCWLGSLQNSV